MASTIPDELKRIFNLAPFIADLGVHDNILAVRDDELEDLLRAGSEVLADLDCSRLVEDTDV